MVSAPLSLSGSRATQWRRERNTHALRKEHREGERFYVWARYQTLCERRRGLLALPHALQVPLAICLPSRNMATCIPIEGWLLLHQAMPWP
jgi:hypothetical protein